MRPLNGEVRPVQKGQTVARGPEAGIQTQIVKAYRARFDVLVYHNANGGLRSKTEAVAFRDMGTLAGVPDLTVIGRASATFCVECKSRIQSRERAVSPFERYHSLSPNQKVVVPEMRARGIPVAVVDNVDEAIQAAQTLGIGQKLKIVSQPRQDVGF